MAKKVNYKKLSKEKKRKISRKIEYLIEHEGVSQDQAIAMAINMVGRGKKHAKKSGHKKKGKARRK
jgi:hypothetical protein